MTVKLTAVDSHVFSFVNYWSGHSRIGDVAGDLHCYCRPRANGKGFATTVFLLNFGFRAGTHRSAESCALLYCCYVGYCK